MVVASWIGGWRRVAQALAMAAGVHALSFLLALPFGLAVRDQIAAQLGSSLAAGAVADGVTHDWWGEFTAQATGLGATFTPSIIGFASTLDTLSRVLDARYPPRALLWLLGGYLALWTFLSGGILDRYARQRPTRAHGFFSASGRLFFRLARLTAMAGVLYWLLFTYIHPWLFLDVLRDLTRGLGVERTSFLWRLLFYALFGLVVLKVNLVFDYARIRLVVEDRRSALGALRARRAPRLDPFPLATSAAGHGALCVQRRRVRAAARAVVRGLARRLRHRPRDVGRFCRRPAVSLRAPCHQAALPGLADRALPIAPRPRQLHRGARARLAGIAGGRTDHALSRRGDRPESRPYTCLTLDRRRPRSPQSYCAMSVVQFGRPA